jgi:hypothetical protein
MRQKALVVPDRRATAAERDVTDFMLKSVDLRCAEEVRRVFCLWIVLNGSDYVTDW